MNSASSLVFLRPFSGNSLEQALQRKAAGSVEILNRQALAAGNCAQLLQREGEDLPVYGLQLAEEHAGLGELLQLFGGGLLHGGLDDGFS
jgi:hypothetical protein